MKINQTSLPVNTTALTGVKPQAAKEEAPVMFTDTIEKGGEPLPASFKDMLAETKAAGGESFLDKNSKLVIGAAIGGGIGGIIGGVTAHHFAMNDVNSLPIKEVRLQWDAPVYQDKNIGSIPSDYYEPNNSFGFSFTRTSQVPVFRSAPVIEPATGKPQMQQMDKTWTEHGEPVVRWNQKSIDEPVLKGYSESRIEDSISVPTGKKDQDGSEISQKVVKGWQHYFSPDVSSKAIGSFKEPQVTFETGVAVGLRTFVGVLAGVLTGGVAGAVASSVIGKMMDK